MEIFIDYIHMNKLDTKKPTTFKASKKKHILEGSAHCWSRKTFSGR